MNRRAQRHGWALTAVAVGATLTVFAAVMSMLVHGRPVDVFYARWMFHNVPTALVMVWMGHLVLRRQPAHGAGVVLLAVGAVAAAHAGVIAIVDARLLAAGIDVIAAGTPLVPAELPLDASVPLWVMWWLWVPVPVLAMTGLLLVFPDGQLPGGRWRWALVSAVVGAALLMLAHAIVSWPTATTPISSTEVPLGEAPLTFGLATAGGVAVLAAALASVAALVGRWRHAHEEQRGPFRAVGSAAIVLALAGTLTWPWQQVWRPVVLVAFVGLLVTYSLAVGRYRLHDLDPAISRAAVGAILAAGVTGIYAAVVVGVGSIVDRAGDSGLLPLIAVGVVAVLIEPARRQTRQLVERVLYGRDTDRAEALSQLATLGRTAGDLPDMVAHVAELLVHSTGAKRAEVWLDSEGRSALAAAAGAPAADVPLVTAPVIHHGDHLGAIRLYARKPSDLVDDARPLVSDVADSLGVALHNARLTGELRERLEELQRSRHRLVEVHHEARRELERDIHDGAQARLIGLRLRVGAARALVDATTDATLAEQLEEIGREVDAAVQSLRDLARGLYPRVLEESGVAAAIQAAARDLPIVITVQAEHVGRYQRHVEAAVYFACLEALQNAARHAQATRITVRLEGEPGKLRFSVVDDGIGFDPEGVRGGTGLANMHDRLSALGGHVWTNGPSGPGTTISGEIPLHATSTRPGEAHPAP